MLVRVVGLVVLVACGLAGLVVWTPLGDKPTGVLWQPPEVTPRPQQLAGLDRPIQVPQLARLRLSGDVDQTTKDLLDTVLRGVGVGQVQTTTETGGQSGLTVVAGLLSDGAVSGELRSVAGRVPDSLPAEGYALASKGGTIVLAGADPDGIYYAAQTLRQLAGKGTIASVSIVDYPSTPIRGVIEGFYGVPWTSAQQMDQLAYYGSLKLNTFIYAPKDDPFHRANWRDPYPADDVAQLGQLVDTARDNHVRFTFALSPGVSICYGDPDDLAALEAKLDAMYDLGVRRFVIPLDDIDYRKWNCDADQAAYGDPSPEAAARAQTALLNEVQTGFIDQRPGALPLTMVPTEYYDVADSPYKAVIRQGLDRRVSIMWTGIDVIPTKISVADADAAAAAWGRRVFLWDNYPVNDFDAAQRIHLAPYAERENGLAEALSGMVLNPMSEAAASKVAILGGADFAWHDKDYDPARTLTLAAHRLAGADQRTVPALLAFFDAVHLAPTSTPQPSQPQSPLLADRLAEFTASWSRGDRAGALAELRPYAQLLADAPEQIRSGTVDPGFVAECGPWLNSLALWGQAFLHTLDALAARLAGNEQGAKAFLSQATTLAGQASSVHSQPDVGDPVKVADGVLDVFLRDAAQLS